MSPSQWSQTDARVFCHLQPRSCREGNADCFIAKRPQIKSLSTNEKAAAEGVRVKHLQNTNLGAQAQLLKNVRKKKINTLPLLPTPEIPQKTGRTFFLKKTTKSLYLGTLTNLKIIHIRQRRVKASHSGAKGMWVSGGHVTGRGERVHGAGLLRRGEVHDLSTKQRK